MKRCDRKSYETSHYSKLKMARVIHSCTIKFKREIIVLKSDETTSSVYEYFIDLKINRFRSIQRGFVHPYRDFICKLNDKEREKGRRKRGGSLEWKCSFGKPGNSEAFHPARIS